MTDTDAQNAMFNITLPLTTNVSLESQAASTAMDSALTVLPHSEKLQMGSVPLKDASSSQKMDAKHAKAPTSLPSVDALISTAFKCQAVPAWPALMALLSAEMVSATRLFHSAKLTVWIANVLNARSDITLTSLPLMQSAENKNSAATTSMANVFHAEPHSTMFLKPNHVKLMDVLLISSVAAHNVLPAMILDTTHANCQTA